MDEALKASVVIGYKASAKCTNSNTPYRSSSVVIGNQANATNGTAKALVSVAVPDFAQLSENHPHHPNRIIFAGNYRPRSADGKTTGKTTVHPYTIAVSVSEANAKAAATVAEGEAEYMRILSDAYADEARSDFYTFVLSLDAAKTSLVKNKLTNKIF